MQCLSAPTRTEVDAAIPVMYTKARDNKLDRLSNADCIVEYAESIQTKRRNVLLVTADDRMPPPNSTEQGTVINIYAYTSFEAGAASSSTWVLELYKWICSGLDPNLRSQSPCSNHISGIKNASESWTVSLTGYYDLDRPPNYPVDYCLSEAAEPRCKVQFLLPIAVLITVLNFFKAVLIFYTALKKGEDPLLTMGDAVASFLERRDETTRRMCLLSVKDVRIHDGYFPAGPTAWKGERHYFKSVTSERRRTVTFLL